MYDVMNGRSAPPPMGSVTPVAMPKGVPEEYSALPERLQFPTI